MRMTVARAARIVNRANLPFAEHVRDPRERSAHSLAGILSVMVGAFSCVNIGLREIEGFSDSLPRKMLNRLGLKKSVSDTTLYEVLPRVEPNELRPVLWEQIRRELDSKAICNDLFPGGVVTFDGKGAGSGMGEAPNPICRNSVCDAEGTKCWDAFTLRACLTSSAVRPILDQQYIIRKKNESSTFPEIFGRIDKQFPKLFRYVTWDAGLTSAANANLIIAAGKHYVGAIKANFSKTFPLAIELLKPMSVVAASENRAQGKQIKRELRRISMPSEVKFPGATELWSVRQTSVNSKGKTTEEERIFIVSIPPEDMKDEARLDLVRLHWGIENGPNWTADVLLREDTRVPCSAGQAVLVVGWLRSVAYNLLSVFRAHLPLKDRRPESWKESAKQIKEALLIYDLLLALQESAITFS